MCHAGLGTDAEWDAQGQPRSGASTDASDRPVSAVDRRPCSLALKTGGVLLLEMSIDLLLSLPSHPIRPVQPDPPPETRPPEGAEAR